MHNILSKNKVFIVLFIICLLFLSLFFDFSLSKRPNQINLVNFNLIDSNDGLQNKKSPQDILNSTLSNLKLLTTAYHIKFYFKPENFRENEYQNLFQTDSLNNGLRAEIHNQILAFIIADKTDSSGYKVLQIPKKIVGNHWYKIEIYILRNNFLYVFVDDIEYIHFISNGISFSGNNLKVREGFSSERKFTGDIKDIQFKQKFIENKFSFRCEFTFHKITKIIDKIRIIAQKIYFKYIHFAETINFIFICFLILSFIKLKKYLFIRIPKILLKKPVFFSTLAQAIFLIALPAYRYSLLMYIFLFGLGLGIYFFIAPKFLNRRFDYLVTIPIYGLISLVLICMLLIFTNINFILAPLSLAFFMLVSFVSIFFLKKREIKTFFLELKINFDRIFLYYTCIGTPIVLLLLIPVLFTHPLSSLMRIGPDIGSYSKMATFLFEGGTWKDAILRANEFLGMSVGEMNRYSDATMTYPFMYSYRFGLSSYQAVYALLFNFKHVFSILFLSMLIPYALAGALVTIWFKNLGKANLFLILSVPFAFLFNVNILNLWYEGFYGNSFSLVFYILVVYIFLQLRLLTKISLIELCKVTILLFLIFIVIFSSYAESLIYICAPIFIATIFSEYLFTKKIKLMPYLLILFASVFSFLFLMPLHFVVDWFFNTVSQLIKEGGNGFPQPHWALPNEIFGLSNLYSEIMGTNGGVIIRRSWLTFIFSVITSFGICYSIFMQLKERNKNYFFYFSCLLIFILESLFVVIRNPHNNYMYMKLYVFLLPFMFIFFWQSLDYLHIKLKNFFKVDRLILYGGLTSLIFINGLIYIATYKIQATSVADFKIKLYQSLEKVDLSNAIIYPYKINTSIIEYSSIFNAPWIRDHYLGIVNNDKFYYERYLDKNLFLFLEKDQNMKYTVDTRNIILNTECCLLVNSNFKLADALNNSQSKINLDLFKNLIKETLKE